MLFIATYLGDYVSQVDVLNSWHKHRRYSTNTYLISLVSIVATRMLYCMKLNSMSPL
jgi:hypothetical protein